MNISPIGWLHTLGTLPAMFKTPAMGEQGRRLEEVASLIDAGRIRSTANNHLVTINALNPRRDHPLVEGGKPQGKWFWLACEPRQAAPTNCPGNSFHEGTP